jgi:exopolysaccharide biosynthesis operon protein EpsL
MAKHVRKVNHIIQKLVYGSDVFYPMCLLCVLANPVSAFAGILGDSLTPYVSARSTYHSNIFYLSENQPIDPNISQRWDILVRTDVGLIADIPIERQRILADLNVNFNQYQTYDFLDYMGANSKLRWDWVIGQRWRGNVGYNYNRFLTSFNNFITPVQDITDNHNPYAEFGFHFHPDWEVAGAFSYLDSSHSEITRSFSDYTEYAYTAELRHRNAAGNYLGIELNYNDVDFPNRGGGALQTFRAYEQYSAGATIDWRLTGKSTVRGRLGYTILESSPTSAQNFDQVTWRLEYRWRATAKTSIDLATWREIRPVVDPVSSFIKDTGVGLIPLWEPTEKISVRGEMSYMNQDYSGSGTGQQVGLEQRTDDVYRIGVNLGYKPLQKILLELIYNYENRSSNRAFLDYFFHSVSGSVRIEF